MTISGNDVDRYLEDSKSFAVLALNRQFENAPFKPYPMKPSDLYIVWFSKTLGNFKALLSTDRHPGIYVEVTFNGAKAEAYVDVYRKQSNTNISESELADFVLNQYEEEDHSK